MINKETLYILLNKAFKKSGGITPTGKINIVENGSYNVINYAQADVMVEGFPPDWTEIGYDITPENIIEGFSYAKKILQNWDSSLTSIQSLFYNDKKLIFFPYLETENTENILNGMQAFAECSSLIDFPENIEFNSLADASRMFQNCTALKTISLQLPSVTSVNGMFQGCTSLEDIYGLDLSQVYGTGLNGFVASCPSLTDECLETILQLCIGSNVTVSNWKRLSSVGLSLDQATRCENLPSYQDFLDAGWTSGY